ncbi:MAG: hypothetical protein CML16_02410 [Pusillimonas sp.]|nr:hypothetical protein [Pusillimonas sp.]MBC41703.1 hypothetical protein [Pusillimonas sp.]HCP77005.1 hypothetical protein [Pusillimonas sp.]|tara:strand:- start:11728 stop:13308 length:1581 start_codon:yes stop_codon:yes gene_type:complete
MNHYDVIITGFGPTGATLANLLVARGLSVAVFDRLPDLYPLPRAIGIDHEGLRIMQEVGIADALQDSIASYRPSEYRGVDGQPILRLDSAPAPHRLGWAPNYVFNQPALERTLRDRLAGRDGAAVFLEAEVVDSGQDAGSAWVDVRLMGQASVTRYSTAYLVACDGGGSAIRKRLGLELEDLGFDEAWLVIDAIVNDDKLADLPDTQVQYCEPDRPCTFVVGPGNHRRWEVMLLPGEQSAGDYPEAVLWPLLSRWLKPGEGRLWRHAAYRFHGLVARNWREGRTLLAGDAAHMTPPFMAQGMVQGMRDALNLAWKLERVLKGMASDALLDSYERERHPHVVATTNAAMDLGRIICEKDPEKARQRDVDLRARQGGIVKTTIRQNMIPGLTSGLIDETAPGAGELFPQPRVVVQDGDRQSTGWLDDFVGARSCLLSIGECSQADSIRLQDMAQRINATLICICVEQNNALSCPGMLAKEDGAVMAPWLASLGCRYVISRPDHYVYGAAPDMSALERLVSAYAQGLGG